MRKIVLLASSIVIGPAFLVSQNAPRADGLTRWKISDRNRPLPPVVTPGAAGTPPSDAIVLFDGKDLSKWESNKGGPPGWKLVNGAIELVPGSGDIRTRQAFGDCQLHIEWAEPNPPHGKDQGRGNSGVYLMNKYEVQILDSYDNKTYFDGQCGSIYKQKPPLVNACRKPGEWQTYDIVFTAPQFDDQKKLIRPGYVTVLHNGVLIQDHFELEGSSSWYRAPAYEAHPDKLPIHIQDHGNPVRFRNIWIREL